MAMYGYARVSTLDQSTDIQEEALRAAGCDVVRAEKVSGTSRKGRSELQTILDFMRPNDTLVVTRIDRLARSISDLQNIINEIKEKGGFLRCVEQPVDTTTAAGKAFLDMLGVFAEFETNLRKERQREGIERAKKEGKFKGRKPVSPSVKKRVLDMSKEDKKVTEISSELNIAVSTIYKIISSNSIR